MKTKMQKKREFRELTADKPTKKYDKVATKIRKLLSATAQTFIPELCEALKQDWFPTMPHKELQKNEGVREEIRNKIIRDWSNDNIYSKSQDNVWKESTINIFLPDWLRNPTRQLSSVENLAKANKEKLSKKNLINQAQKQKIEQIAETLPDDVIVPDPDELTAEEKAEKDRKFWEFAQEIGVAEYGTTGKSPRNLTGDILLHSYKLFEALTNIKKIPRDNDDILVDFIRPSREFRRGLMLEVDHRKRVTIHNVLHYVSIALEDMIEIISEIDRKEEE